MRYFIIGCTYQVKTSFIIFVDYHRAHGIFGWNSEKFPNVNELVKEVSKDILKTQKRKAYNMTILSVNEVSYEDYKEFWKGPVENNQENEK